MVKITNLYLNAFQFPNKTKSLQNVIQKNIILCEYERVLALLAMTALSMKEELFV